jgi:hypothetical protein
LGIVSPPGAAILGAEVMTVARRLLPLVLPALALVAGGVTAEEWSRARISYLPDSAFAVVEVAEDGRPVRHLPHHDETGALDLPHLRAARARLGQVTWLDPANEARARRHLEAHWREIHPPSF